MLAQALEVLFIAVPLPKKAPAETLGGKFELTETGADFVATEAAGHGAHGADGA